MRAAPERDHMIAPAANDLNERTLNAGISQVEIAQGGEYQCISRHSQRIPLISAPRAME
jgi:hypothetical protein